MQYLALSFFLASHDLQKAEACLEQSHALSITTEDAKDTPILEPGPGETPFWPQLKITALFQENAQQAKIIRRLQHALPALQTASLHFELTSDQDWTHAWMQHYEPLQWGDALWIGSSEHTPSSSCKAHLFLDPGLAFGTGTHPTTFLCLAHLSTLSLQDKTIIDYGCGSGILMLAALQRGAAHAIGIDIDPQALLATAENAKRNQIPSTHIELHDTDPPLKQEVDIVVANILANPLILLAPRLTAFLRPEGTLILAGLLLEQKEQVMTAYTGLIDWEPCTEKDGWVCLKGQKIS